MKRFGVLALITALVLGLAVYFTACGGGGGSNNNNNTVTYSSPEQAAASSQAFSGAIALSSAVSEAADMAGSSIPAGYAPSLRAKNVDTTAIANIDPRLKAAVDKMIADLQLPEIRSALAKAPSLNAMSAATISTTITCSVSGSINITGSDNSTSTYNAHTVNVVFNNCQNAASYPYVILSGSLQADDKHMIDNSSDTKNVTATNLSVATYVSGTTFSTDVLNGTFKTSYTVAGGVTSGENDVNGSISENSNIGTTVINATVGFSNVSDVWSSTTTSTATTEEHAVNGGFSFVLSSDGSTFTANITLTNLDNKVSTYLDGSEDQWINGSVTMSWSPNPGGSSCIPGTITVTTDPARPIYTPNITACPTSGYITVNNATIEFGVPAPSGVTVTVGGSSKELTDCSQLGGGQCI